MGPIGLVKQVLQLLVWQLQLVSLAGMALQLKQQPNKNNLAQYKSLLHLYNNLTKLYISNMTECFNYKGGCGMRGQTCIETFETRVGLDYRQMALCYW